MPQYNQKRSQLTVGFHRNENEMLILFWLEWYAWYGPIYYGKNERVHSIPARMDRRPCLWSSFPPRGLSLLPCTLTFDNISSYLVFIIVASLLNFSVVARWSCPSLLKKISYTVLVLLVLKPVNQINQTPQNLQDLTAQEKSCRLYATTNPSVKFSPHMSNPFSPSIPLTKCFRII